LSAVIFCGPTLSADDLAPYAHFTIRPPVRQGELYGAAQAMPKAIGIVDGYFDGLPAVWHKEILWALQAGIAVFGASSMGALRAAELHSFGMRGVGRIFEDYRDGRLTDDDEVALLHGPQESGYLKLSEPMVNVRATLERAVSERALDAAAANRIAAVAKAQFYQERTWSTVLAAAAKVVPGVALDRLAAWLPGGRVDRKREDALELLRAVDDFVASGEREPPASFSFEWTETWANAPWRSAPQAFEDSGGGEEGAILDELRLDGDAYARVRHAALLAALASEEIARTGLAPERREIARAAMQFRSPRALARQSDIVQWAAENGTEASHFDRLMADSAGLEKLARTRDANLRGAMLDQLRLEDAYPKLRRRARAKARAHAAASGRAVTIRPPVLTSWYFGTRLKRSVPDDLADYAAGIGLGDLKDFYALIAAEYAVAADRKKRRGSGRSGK
jgi:AraC-like DNA-binding protein